MTMEEAIKHCEEVAEANERLCETIHPSLQWSDYGKCADEHRQLAEWLKDYKRLLEQELIYNSAESKLKNPKAKTFDILRFISDNAGLSNFEVIEKAYHMGVSEQECILNKIRAEIAELQLIGYATVDGKREIASKAVMQVIDKYTAESEE